MGTPITAKERLRRGRQSATDKERSMGSKQGNGHLSAVPEAWEATDTSLVIAPAVEPEVLLVTVQEWLETQEDGPDGQPVRKRKRRSRVAEIDTFVSAKVMAQLLGEIEQMPRALLNQSRSKDGQRQFIFAMLRPETTTWVYRQVLRVWQQSEPDMTLEGLQEAFEFPEMMDLWGKLFTRRLNTIFGQMPTPPPDQPAPDQSTGNRP